MTRREVEELTRVGSSPAPQRDRGKWPTTSLEDRARRESEREPYVKPTVTRVRLDAKEVAVAACKVLGGATAQPDRVARATATARAEARDLRRSVPDLARLTC